MRRSACSRTRAKSYPASTTRASRRPAHRSRCSRVWWCANGERYAETRRPFCVDANLVFDGAVDVRATLVIDHSIVVVEVSDKGGAHVHGAVKDHPGLGQRRAVYVNVDASVRSAKLLSDGIPAPHHRRLLLRQHSL